MNDTSFSHKHGLHIGFFVQNQAIQYKYQLIEMDFLLLRTEKKHRSDFVIS